MTTNKIALITGANKGIGFETARQLATAGHTVLIGARDTGRGETAAAKLRADGADARFVRLDVTDESSVRAAAAWIETEFGRLDVLVNNAGTIGAGSRDAAPSATPVPVVRETYETNVFGVITVINTLLPLLRRAPAARIVNLSSELGSITVMTDPETPWARAATLLAYNSSKSALNAVTTVYAAELAGTPIKINAVSPGYCATDMNDHQGFLTPADGARVPVRAATLPADGPTGTFFGADGPIPW